MKIGYTCMKETAFWTNNHYLTAYHLQRGPLCDGRW